MFFLISFMASWASFNANWELWDFATKSELRDRTWTTVGFHEPLSSKQGGIDQIQGAATRSLFVEGLTGLCQVYPGSECWRQISLIAVGVVSGRHRAPLHVIKLILVTWCYNPQFRNIFTRLLQSRAHLSILWNHNDRYEAPCRISGFSGSQPNHPHQTHSHS